MSSSNLGKRRRSRCYFMKARGSIGKLKGWRDKLINKNLSNDGFRKLFVSNMFPLQWKTGRNLLISPPINRFGPTQNYLNLACWTKSPKTRSIPTIHFEGTIHNIKSGRPCTLKLFLLEESQTRKPLSLLTILICKSKKIFCNLTQFPVFQFGGSCFTSFPRNTPISSNVDGNQHVSQPKRLVYILPKRFHTNFKLRPLECWPKSSK